MQQDDVIDNLGGPSLAKQNNHFLERIRIRTGSRQDERIRLKAMDSCLTYEYALLVPHLLVNHKQL